jgi:hypothetical protein
VTFARLAGYVIRAIAAGLLLGVGGRVVMRAIALLAGLAPESSLGGSLEVILFGCVLGVPVALVFFALRTRAEPGAWWPGLATGVALGIGITLIPPGPARGALAGTPIHPGIAIALFLGLFAIYGLLLELLWRWPRRTAHGVSARIARGRLT